eukprot:Pompholyxophrys_punicea_v1_NODE_849_length_1218_cov_2.926913.p1 type:complete len:281 gc:universal NODE_849_length_1218_cov_2.926913:1062-220(-)
MLSTLLNFVSEVVEVLATFTKAEVLKSFYRGKSYVGVMIDESTDISFTSQMVIYYRLAGIDGNARVVFGGIEALENGEAETIYSTLLTRLKNDEIPLSSVCSFGSDGASVMLGRNNGVSSRILSHNSFMVAFHCVCHREALAVEAAAAEVDYLAKSFFPTIEALGRYFEASGTRTASFRATQVNLQLEPVKIVKSAFTRWLSHDSVTKVIFDRCVPLVVHLNDNSNDVVALGLHAILNTEDFFYWICVMRDVLPILAGFCNLKLLTFLFLRKFFQRSFRK